MASQFGDIPLLDPVTGKLPDEFAPPSIAADVIDASESAGLADVARVDAQRLRNEAAVITGLTGEDEAVALLVNDHETETASAIIGAVGAGVAFASASSALGAGYGFDLASIDTGHWVVGKAGAAVVATLSQSDGGRTLCKTTDGGRTWTTLGKPSNTNAPASLWVATTGTWFVYVNGGDLYRSTDDGMTWTLAQHTGTLLCDGFTEDSAGNLWCAEYLGDARIWRSTNDGTTWTVVHNFPNTDGGDGTQIRHVHGILAFGADVWCFTGDSGPEAGFWKWDGSAMVRQSPPQTDAQGGQTWRAVSITKRGDWFYWIQDGGSPNSPLPPGIFKAKPSDLAGTVKRLATVPSGGWYIDTLPSGELVVGSIAEPVAGVPSGRELDSAVRLWVIDNTDTVHEALTIPYANDANNDFPGIRNLVIMDDGTLWFRINNTGPTGSSYASATGTVIKGGRTLGVSTAVTPGLYPASRVPARVWTAVGVAESPNISGASAAGTVPDMSIVVPCTGRPMLVIGHVSLTTSATAGMLDVTVDGTYLGQYSRLGKTSRETSVTISAVVTPTRGDRTIAIGWTLPGTGGTMTAYGKWRRLQIVEL